MTTPAGGIEPDLVERMTDWSLPAHVKPEMRPAYREGWNDCRKLILHRWRASTATASLEPRWTDALATMRAELLNEGVGAGVWAAFLNLRDVQPPLEHLTERSALQPEAPCEDLADTRRLDWLDAHPRESSMRFDDHTFKTVKAWAIAAAPSLTIRDAIDAAMEERP